METLDTYENLGKGWYIEGFNNNEKTQQQGKSFIDPFKDKLDEIVKDKLTTIKKGFNL